SPSLFSILSTTPHTPHICTLSLHDALPILPWWATLSKSASGCSSIRRCSVGRSASPSNRAEVLRQVSFMTRDSSFFLTLSSCASDRKSTRLNSSHVSISYAVFCLKKKNIYL